MSLDFGFGLYNNDAAVQKIWDRKYEALSKEDQKFYHEVLPWALVTTDVGIINELTIPHIVARARLVDEHYWVGTMPKNFEGSVDDYLKRFIGFRANVRITTSGEFIKKITDNAKRRCPKLSKDDPILKVANPSDLIVDELTDEDLPLFINHKWYSEMAAARYRQRCSVAAVDVT